MRHATKAVGEGASRLGDPVLEAGAHLFDKDGWERTSLDRVASASHTPLDEVLRRYPTRDHLAAGIFSRVLDLVPRELSSEIEANAPLEDRLFAVIVQELGLLEPHKAFVRQALGRLFQPFNPSIPLQAPLAMRFIAFVSEQIAVARDRRQIGKWVIPSVAATAFWALHLRILVRFLGDQGRGSEATYLDAHRWIRDFVRTLGGREARRARDERPTSASPSTPDLLIFEGQGGAAATRAFLVDNVLDRRITPKIHASRFIEPDGHAVHPDVSIAPANLELGPGENVVVRATVTIPATLLEGAEYRGTLEVEGLPHAQIPAALRRTEEVVVLADAPKPAGRRAGRVKVKRVS